MSFWSRITYAFRGDRLNHEIDEEFAAHFGERRNTRKHV